MPEKKELAESTASEAPPKPGLPSATREVVVFVQEQSKSNKVVVWLLKYCKFCWTLRRFLDRLGVPYMLIDIDSFQYTKNNMCNKYRAALSDETDCVMFPQFFVQGKFIGGAVDTCMMWKRASSSCSWKTPA